MALASAVSPLGKITLDHADESTPANLSDEFERRISLTFERGESEGLEHLATVELQTALPASLSFASWREIISRSFATPRRRLANRLSPSRPLLQIASTFWGKSGYQNLKSYSDFANRLPRGRTCSQRLGV